MGVTVLPDYTGETAKNLGIAGEGIADLINPFRKFQAQLSEAVSANPQLAHELAALEHENPGFLSSLHAGKVGERIASLVPSFSEIVGNAGKEYLGSLSPDELGGLAVAKSFGMTPSQLQTERLIAPSIKAEGTKRPELATAGAQVALSGQTDAQRNAAEQQATLNQQRIKEGEFLQGLTGLAYGYIAALPMDEQVRGAAREKVPGFFAEKDMQDRFSQAVKLALINNTNDYAAANDRSKDNEADQWVRRTGVGDRDTWKLFLFDPTAGPLAKVGGGDAKIQEVAKAFTAVSAEIKAAEFAITAREIANTVDRLEGRAPYKKPNDADKAMLLTQLNFAFAKQAKLGGPALRAVPNTPMTMGDLVGSKGERKPGDAFYGSKVPTIPFTGKGIKYVDPSGREMEPEEVVAITATPMVGQNMRDFAQAAPAPAPAAAAPEKFDVTKVDIRLLSPRAREAYRRIRLGQGTLEQLRQVDAGLANELQVNAAKKR